MEGGVRFYDWLILFAILFGPLIGVWVTRWIDAAKDERTRRWELFATLRRTKGLELSTDHVAAINMVPVLFANDLEAVGEWEKLMAALNNTGWTSSDESIREGVIKSAGDARHNLIRRIGELVGAKLPIKEEHRLGYAPMAWANEMMEQAEARKMLLQVLNGHKPLNMIAGVYQLTPDPLQNSEDDTGLAVPGNRDEKSRASEGRART